MKGGRSELRRYLDETTAAARMLKTNADRAAERQATAHAERALRAPIGNRLSLDDPYGDRLRKADSHLTALEAIRKVHAGAPVQVSHFPPRSDNAHWDEVRADDGAELAHEATDPERQQGGVRPKPTLATSPHTASMRALRALETMDDGGKDPTVEAIKVSQRIPHPLVPGALHVSPNRDDALRRRY